MTAHSTSIGHVHICHSPANAAYVAKLANHLTNAGVAVTSDGNLPRDVPWDALRNRVDASSAVLVVMTPDSRTDEHVEVEIAHAESKQRPIFPLLLSGKVFFRLAELRHWNLAHSGMPDDELIRELKRAVGADPSHRPGVAAAWWQKKVGVAAIAAAAVAVVLGVTALWPSAARGPVPPRPGPPTSAVETVPPGVVKITNLADGDLVAKCAPVTGLANLRTDKTLLVSIRRTDPVSTTYFINYVGAYQQGFVPTSWHGAVYFGTSTRQSYELFVLVMDVRAAQTFWNAHKTNDGSFATSTVLPPNATRVTRLRVRQGSTNDC